MHCVLFWISCMEVYFDLNIFETWNRTHRCLLHPPKGCATPYHAPYPPCARVWIRRRFFHFAVLISISILIMRIKVGILVNEVCTVSQCQIAYGCRILKISAFQIVLPLPNKNKSSFHANGPFATASIEITVFGKYKRTRSYGIVSPSTPILPCEQLHFSKVNWNLAVFWPKVSNIRNWNSTKAFLIILQQIQKLSISYFQDFIGYPSIGDLLRSFEREPFSMRLIVEHPDIPQYSNSHREVVAEYEDNALNVFYPYHTLHPSYDHVTRRLHLNCLKVRFLLVLQNWNLKDLYF